MCAGNISLMAVISMCVSRFKLCRNKVDVVYLSETRVRCCLEPRWNIKYGPSSSDIAKHISAFVLIYGIVSNFQYIFRIFVTLSLTANTAQYPDRTIQSSQAQP